MSIAKYGAVLLVAGLVLAIVLTKVQGNKIYKDSPKSKTGIERWSKYYSELVNNHDPGEALDDLDQRIEVDLAVKHFCHTLTHVIGREAYKKIQDFGQAASLDKNLCGGGYLHGVTQAYLDGQPDKGEAIKSVCQMFPVDPEVISPCYHGVGHAVMYQSNNDVSESLLACESLGGGLETEDCVEGVFMEAFGSDEVLHTVNFSFDQTDPWRECAQQKSRYQKHCYYYIPARMGILGKTDTQIIEACLDKTLGKAQKWCIQGTAIRVAQEEGVEKINNSLQFCMILGVTNREVCWEEVIDFFMAESSLQASENLCMTINQAAQDQCQDLLMIWTDIKSE